MPHASFAGTMHQPRARGRVTHDVHRLREREIGGWSPAEEIRQRQSLFTALSSGGCPPYLSCVAQTATTHLSSPKDRLATRLCPLLSDT